VCIDVRSFFKKLPGKAAGIPVTRPMQVLLDRLYGTSHRFYGNLQVCCYPVLLICDDLFTYCVLGLCFASSTCCHVHILSSPSCLAL
jgi:hypothetical protein